MTETLLSPSNVTLFGRVVTDISIKSDVSHDPSGATPEGMTSALGTALKKAQFARIYGFCAEGTYVEMTTPTLMLVHGDGKPASEVKCPGPSKDDTAFYNDLMAWSYDRSDRSMRLDVDSGTIAELLLGGNGGGRVSGAYVGGGRVSGEYVTGPRVSGAYLSGAYLSGARGGGGRVSGAYLGGTRGNGAGD